MTELIKEIAITDGMRNRATILANDFVTLLREALAMYSGLSERLCLDNT